MIKGIGHLGIVVADIEKSLEALSKVLEFEKPAIKEFPEKKVRCSVLEVNGVALEFLEDNSEEGFLAQFGQERGHDAIHHFCLLSDDIEADVEDLKQRGIEMMDQKPRIGLRGKKIAMTQPQAFNGITIELSEP